MTEREFAWVVPTEHPAFAGHFPGRPIVPGVVLLDRAIGFANDWLDDGDARWQIGNAKFLRPVGPGETLRFLLRQRPGGGIAFTVRNAAGDVASGSLSPLPTP